MVAIHIFEIAIIGAALMEPVALAALSEAAQKPFGSSRIDDKDESKTSPFNAEMDELAEQIMKEWHVPGISMAVVDGNETFAKGFGLATLPDTPATPETLYYVGSTTKAHTAAALAHLIDTKAFPELSAGWSTPISSIIRDDFVLQDEWATAHLTLEDAVSHRTGMSGHDNSWHRDINGSQATIRDVVRNGRNLPFTGLPRTRWNYCNYMFVVLSHVIEVVTGQWLGQVMRELIWEPLGMNSTYLDLDEAKRSSAHLASSYIWRPHEERYDELPFLGIKEVSGAGGVISNVLDYTQWLKCLIHETKPFSKTVHKDIQTPRFIADPQPSLESDVTLYGLAWWRMPIHGHAVYWHSGSTLTFGALVCWVPELKFGIVAFGNGAMTAKNAELILLRKLLEDKMQIPIDKRPDLNKAQRERALQRQRDFESADDILYPNRPKQALPPSVDFDQMAGTYFHNGYGSVTFFKEPVSTRSDESVLVANRTELTWQQQWRLHHISGDHWTIHSFALLGVNEISDVWAAKFNIGVDGKVTSLEVDIKDEPRSAIGSLITFQKV